MLLDYETISGILSLLIIGLIVFSYNIKDKFYQFIVLEVAVIAMVFLTSHIKGIQYNNYNIKYFAMFFALYSSHVLMLFAGLKLKNSDSDSLLGSYLLSASISGAIISIGWNFTNYPLNSSIIIMAVSFWSALTAIFCIFISKRISALFIGFVLFSLPVFAHFYNSGNIKDIGDVVVIAFVMFIIMGSIVGFVSRIINGPEELSNRERISRDKEEQRINEAISRERTQKERVEAREKKREQIRRRHGMHEWDKSEDHNIDFGHNSKYLD